VTVPLPSQGSTSWYSWAQQVHEVTTATMRVVGTGSDPITDGATARPDTDGPVYWMCADGVTPANAAPGDLIWNADA
jgi:hypothetical protein